MSGRERDRPRVHVFGAAHEDLLLGVEALPRAGETVLARAFGTGFGGKGANQAVAAARAGARCTFVGMLGSDERGRRVLANLEAEDVDVSDVAWSEMSPTGIAVVVVDSNGKNQIVVASGSGADMTTTRVDAVLRSCKPCDIVVSQCEIPIHVVEHIVAAGRRAGARVLVNLAPFTSVSRASLAGADLVVLNEHEAASLLGRELPSSAAEAVRQAVALTRTGCLITLGARGSVYAAPDHPAVSVPATPVAHVVDTTGAGDSYVGTLAAHLSLGAEMPTAMKAASLAAAESVRLHGAQVQLRAGAVDLVTRN